MTPMPDDWNDTQLALVRLTAGASVPYCSLELRSFHPEGDENDASVLRRTFGLRALMISEDAFPYDGSPKTEAHMPVLLRLGVRARDYLGGNRLLLHVPEKKTSAAVRILESDSAQDLLAIPERLPESRVANAIDIPPLRLVEGMVEAKLIIENSGDFNKLLSLDRKDAQAFGGVNLKTLTPVTSTRSHWEVDVTPQGLEFDATLPDPTEALLPTGQTQPPLTARLRLERDAAGDYRLRLIGGSNPEDLKKAQKRLAGAFAGILQAEACPLKYRFDAGIEVPPLIWPLVFEGGGLKLKAGTVEIDPAALDLRIVTHSGIEGAPDGLAKAELTRVELITDTNGVQLKAVAGKELKGEDPSYWLKFQPTEDDDTVWERSLEGELKDLPVTLPKDALRERLTALYQGAGVLKPSTSHAPYVFFALRDGWLQYPLLPRKTDDDNHGAATLEPAPETRAIIGRIVFDQAEKHQPSVTRGLVIESAESLTAIVRWSRSNKEVKLQAARLSPGQEEGRLHGFLFAADTSPTAAEAVPDLSRGSAALREVVLDFSRFHEGRRDATFGWKQTGNTSQTWSLAWKPAPGSLLLAWTPLGPYPLATNYAMTRTGVPHPDPSLTRGYFPRELAGEIRMVFTRGADPAVITENELPELLGKTDADRAIGTHFEISTAKFERPIRTALLPTLHGVEFSPRLPETSWKYTATLRHDLPLLDELFANTELPPPESANPQSALPAAPGPAPAPVSAGTDITALYPEDLAQEWRKTESRMRLTWTQDVLIKDQHPVAAALTAPVDVNFKNLAAPLVYTAPVAVALSPALPLGRLQIGGPNGDHSLAAAATGLSGDFKIASNGQDLKPHKSGEVHVTGYGVDQYQHPKREDTYLFDNRGTAFTAVAEAAGTRRRVRHMASGGEPKSDQEFTLLTMPEVLNVKIPGLSLGFHVRDLPVVAIGDVLRFTGIADTTNRFENSIEGRWGQDGQSFSNTDLAQSLHEWRAFPLLDETTPGVLGEYDIPVGNYFRFRPLRLINAEFDTSGAVLKVMILGGLSPRPQGAGAHENRNFAFGEDRVYDRDSLFSLTLTHIAGTAGDPEADSWKASFDAQVLTGRILLAIQMGKPLPDRGICFQQSLEPHDPAGLDPRCYWNSSEAIDATFIMKFAPGAGSALKPEKVTMSARLFGSHLTCTATGSEIEEIPSGLKLTFSVDPKSDPEAQGRLTDFKIEVWLSEKGEDRFAVSGTLQLGRVRPFLSLGELEKPESELSTILSISSDEVQWLDLRIPVSALGEQLKLSIDHDIGAILATIDKFIIAGEAPLFGLEFKAKSLFNLKFTGIVREKPLLPAPDRLPPLATAHLHVDFRELDVDFPEEDMNFQKDGKPLCALEQDWLVGGPPPKDPDDCKDSTAMEGALGLTWSSHKRESPIRWPLGDGIGFDGDPDLKKISEGDLNPPPFKNSGAPARILTLKKDGTALIHKSALHLRNHQIALQDLAWVNGEDSKPQLVPLRALHTVALVAHALGDGTTEVRWTSCDHITFATPDALKTEAAALALVPRHSHRRRGDPTSPSLEYRAVKVHTHDDHHAKDHLPEGVAALENANLSGWHDPALLEYLTTDLKFPASHLLIIGTAALCIPKVVKDDEPPSHAHLAMLPWAIGLGETTLLQLGKTETTWRIATADTWAAHAIHLQAQSRIVALAPDSAEGQLLAALRHTCGAPDPARLIPVAAGLAEPWEASKPKKLNKLEQREDAPFFLHCLLALAACWEKPGKIEVVSTLAPDLDWQAPVNGKSDTGPRLIRLRVAERPAARPQPQDGRVSADLIVLSRERALRLPAFRTIREAVAGLLQDETDRAEMKDFAQRNLRSPLYAIRIVPATRQVVRHNVAEPIDPLESPAALLTDPAHDIVASSALGWPYATGLGNPDELPPMAARIQPQMALQSHAAGFAARGQRVFFPAVATSTVTTAPAQEEENAGATQAIYASFGEHVIFDRGQKPFHYDGPAARHMAPLMPRRRAPLEPNLQTPDLSTPLSAPVIDRLVIGRRPGVLEVSTVSATIVAHTGDRRAALDIGWPGMGRPADIGPVVAAQMRNPRSPVLPADPSLQELPLRRRTYLSLADQNPNPIDEDRSRTKLALFRYWPGIHDVIRLTDPSPADSATAPWYWRIHAELSFEGTHESESISPSWSGLARISLEPLVCDANGARRDENDLSYLANLLGLEEEKSVVATLVVGDHSWVSLPSAAPGASAALSLAFKSEKIPLPIDLREAIASATPDTALFLTVRFPLAKLTGGQPPAADDLDIAGVPEFTLPVMLAPGRQRSVPTNQTTVAFGDPSYDRSLASQTERKEEIFPTAAKPTTNYRLATDRLEYNSSGLLHLAIAPVDDESGGFIPSQQVKAGVVAGEFHGEFTIKFQRAIPNAKPQDPQTEVLQLGPLAGKKLLKTGQTHVFRIEDLVRPADPVHKGVLRGGDTLIIEVSAAGVAVKSVSLRLPIVIKPVIAPPPSVFSVIERLNGVEGTPVRLRLHAPAPLPTRIEFEDLYRDLGLGHVRRRGLYVWHYGNAGPIGKGAQDAGRKNKLDLLKLDRSGGAQLPED